MFQCMLQTRIATFSFLIVISCNINFFKTLHFSTLAAFFSKSQCTARGNRDYVWRSDNHSGYPSNQKKRVENYLGRLNKQMESGAVSAEDLFCFVFFP